MNAELATVRAMQADAVDNTAAATPPCRTATLRGNLPSIALTGLFAIATAATLVVAAPVLIPIVVAVLLNLLLSPVVRYTARFRVPRGLSAAVILTALIGIIGSAVLFLADPAEKWLSESPTNLRQLRAQLLPVEQSLEDLKAVTDEVDELADIADKPNVRPVVVETPGTLENLLGGLPRALGYIGITIFLTYFLLASGDTLMRKIVLLGRTWSARKRTVQIIRRIQGEISRYLATITAINIALGTATALAMYLLGVPNPMLWGAMVCVLNFAPYVGAAVSAAVLTVVGLTTFPTLAEALTVPAVFLLLTILEGQLLTPMVVGRRLSLSPTVVFVSVVVWVFLWGVVGALIAVPIVASIKVFCEYVRPLNPVAGLLSD